MEILLFTPFALQGVVMFIDEFYCHRLRGLPVWERVGHPLDTATLILCSGLCAFFPPTAFALKLYACCALFSCLFITKDEWIHQKLSSGFEQWLHSLLFVLHPINLIALALLWSKAEASWFIKTELTTFCFFGLYQSIYWSHHEGQ